MKEYRLKIAQSGFAAGSAFLIGESTDRTASADTTTPNIDTSNELARFEQAVSTLDQELADAEATAPKESSEIFAAERMLLQDAAFTDAAKDLIRNESLDAAAAATKAGAALSKSLLESENEYIRQRSDDVSGMAARLAGILSGEETKGPDEPAILVAKELSPAQLAAIDHARILGIITVDGAPTTHVSILAGNLSVPYFYGNEEAVATIHTGADLILDEGKLMLDPDTDTFHTAQETMKKLQAERQRAQQAALDTDTRTKVYANIAGPQDLEALLASPAEGIGLFRTEFLFLGEDRAPTEDEQFEIYRTVAEAMGEKESVIRTMDLGSDKKADWLRMPEEKNPALGCRGLRLSLVEKELFRSQLRALLRAAAFGNVKIMIPMIASLWEIDAVRSEIDSCAEELRAKGEQFKIPPLGIMVETPAAAVIADQRAEVVDFFSIGTNDLTQYTLALDREANGLDDYYDPCHESVLRLIGMTAAAGHKHNIPTAICGELGANPDAIPKLIEKGVDELSVSVAKVIATKAHVIEAEADQQAGAATGQVEATSQQPSPATQQTDLAKQQSETTPAPTPLTASAALSAPADGKLIPMQDIPDPAFAGGTLGDCVGILPDNGNIYAPCDGIISGIAETLHAITFTAADGSNILVHVGIDTVTLDGKGFKVLKEAGAEVKAGDLVMEADLDVIRAAGLSSIVIVANCE